MKFYVKDNLKISYIETNLTEEEHIKLGFKIVEERTPDEIKVWFDWYDNQVKQYQRCVRMGIEFDKDIEELDNQAKAYQEELRQLKQGGIVNGN